MRNAILAPTRFIGRTLLVFLAVTVGGVAAGVVLYAGVDVPASPDPAAFQRAMALVNGLHSLMLALIASRLAGSFWTRAGILFALFFGVQGVLTSMETAYFVSNGNLDLRMDLIGIGLAGSAATALVGALAAAALFRSGEPAPRPGEKLSTLPIWRIACAILLYPVVYWVAGMTIALPSEAVTDFYADGIGRIDPASLLALQVLRGAIWTGLALIAVNRLSGPLFIRAGLIGAAFCVFMVAQLLYPNEAMPAAVRWVHFVELTVSNFVYGLIAALLLNRSLQGGRAKAGSQ